MCVVGLLGSDGHYSVVMTSRVQGAVGCCTREVKLFSVTTSDVGSSLLALS